jgi:dTDP-glucose 4,6-dehydratase
VNCIETAISDVSKMPAQSAKKKLLITGGAGFIGSALIRKLLGDSGCAVLNVDKLTYAAVPGALDGFEAHPNYHFAQKDICDSNAIEALFSEFQPDAVMHLAAESHVDRSIDGPADFIQSNIVGTYTMLQAALVYWQGLAPSMRGKFRFLHVSTDEVYGSAPADKQFNEDSPTRPSSPYAASKAAANHLVTAWHATYGLPVLVSSCSNNYGPFQFPEKLIPLAIARATTGQAIPIYGDGQQQRDWLHVDDHVTGLLAVLTAGRAGQSYALGSGGVYSNLDVVTTLCRLLDKISPGRPPTRHEDLITFVDDRPGHDGRYSLDTMKARRELSWQPAIAFTDGLRDTVHWYLDNRAWWEEIQRSVYDGQRLGRISVQVSK